MKYSIIVPVYNVEKYVVECLESIARQTYKDWECIVVDDGSTDNSLQLCQKIAERDSRFILLKQNNLGVSAARNNAIEKVSGDYILFVDSDDYIADNLLEKIEVKLSKEKYDVVLYHFSKLVDDVFLQESVYPQFFDLNKKDVNMLGLYFYKYCDLGTACTKAIKASIIKDNNIRYNNSYYFAEDQMFSLEVYSNINSVECIKERLYIYRTRSASSTESYKIEKLANIEYYIDFLRNNCGKLSLEYSDVEIYINQLYTRLILTEFFKIFTSYNLDKLQRKNAYSQIKKSKLSKKLYPVSLKEKILSVMLKIFGFTITCWYFKLK